MVTYNMISLFVQPLKQTTLNKVLFLMYDLSMVVSMLPKW